MFPRLFPSFGDTHVVQMAGRIANYTYRYFKTALEFG